MMIGNLQRADAAGKLELADKLSPVAYGVTVAEEKRAGNYLVEISVSAPRDWLLKHGFKSHVTLIREDGNKTQLHHDGDLEVGDAVSVTLTATDDTCREDGDLQKKYPELRA